MEDEIIIDAEDCVLGRVAAYSAKKALQGKKIIILNCDKAIVTGDRKMVQEEFRQKFVRGGNAQKGPYVSSNPVLIMKRALRGMLPHKRERGRIAAKNIMCFNDTPLEYASAKKENLKRDIQCKYIRLSELKLSK